jgi:glycine/D-amino acid oxidase-like deaminating enzyme
LTSAIQAPISSIGCRYAKKHYSSGSSDTASKVDITFTCTTSASGSLLLGSSREFSGWDCSPSSAIAEAIIARAAEFLPGLRGCDGDGVNVRVGLRPFAAGGLPFVGPLDAVQGLFLATGHEGSGLVLGPITGEIISSYVVDGNGPQTSSANVLLPCIRLGTC